MALNCAILARGYSGTASVTRSMAEALSDCQSIELVLLNPGPASHRGNRALKAIRATYWDIWAAGRAVKKPGVLISPCNIGMAPKGTPHLLVVQDTMVLDHPKLFDPAYARYAKLLFGFSVSRATHVLTASEHAAESIKRNWKRTPPITVVPWPAPSVRSDSARSLDRDKLTVIMVGATEPHKNHLAGIEAVRLARLLSGEPILLELIGPPGHAERAIAERVSLVDPDGKWIKRRISVQDVALQDAYAGAWCLLQPSLDEGFGLPLLEAGAHALPVVHSGAGSLSEVSPTADAGGTDPILMAKLLHRLLHPSVYTEASRESRLVAHEHSKEGFQERLLNVVRETAT